MLPGIPFSLALLVGIGTTALGLAFALVATRTSFPAKRLLRQLTLLPIITPPFVVGLAIILLFGRSGTITQFVADALGLEAGRWIYGLAGVWFAQMLAFTPIAFLVLIGVVEGVSPSLEEAAQTLRADRWTTFRTVSLPLMRPGLANAFLLGFIESLADFGNPLVLSGNYDVLSDRDLLRDRRRAARPRPGCSPCDRPARSHSVRLLHPATLARQQGLYQRHRQGRCRSAAQPSALGQAPLLRCGDPLGSADRRHVRDDP